MIEFEDLLEFSSFPVKEYVPPVMRCFNANIWESLLINLRVKKGVQGVEDSTKCGKYVPVKFCNCREQHSAAYKGYVKQKQAKEAQKVKIINKI